jgi:CheY-like chemotaxis protein
MPKGGRLDLLVDRCVIDQTSSSEKMMPPGSYVSISVTDTGTGIDPEILSRIFDPFFTTKKIGEGTGLGLSMIYGFTQQSGGQVKVQSSLGVGTTVTLYFPVDDSQPDEPELGPHEAHEAELPSHDETILLVDDEAAIRLMTSELLSEVGYRVIEAVDSVSAMKQAETLERLDLLLTDIGLPGLMNGISLANELKMKYPHLKVLFITGFAGASGLVSPDSATRILTKPFSLNELNSRVHSLLSTLPEEN